MKKNVLALSISAAIGVFGVVGSAHAITDLGVTASTGNATQLKVNNSGIGHNLIIPYYTAQAANATLITLTNTTNVGKAVKIRFRGAENSDDVKDFQVFLSPYDVWTANVSQAASGKAAITTYDASCTKPTLVAGTAYEFGTDRLSAATNVAGTREGYIEIFNMGDIPATYSAFQAANAAPAVVAGAANALATAVTHVAGKAPCSGAAFTALDTDTTAAALLSTGLDLPKTGLTASWIIINTTAGASYGGNATAIQALTLGNTPADGNLVYWPQSTAFVVGETRGYTADPLLAGNLTAVPAVVPPIKALMQDLPDMSTPYIGGLTTAPNTAVNAAASYAVDTLAWAATGQASRLTASLAATSVNNEFFSDSAAVQIGAATDWVFSMPTRRYNVAYNYATKARVFNDYTVSANQTAAADATGLLNYFSLANTAVSGSTICVDGVTPVAFNREEGTNSSVAFSPSASPVFCGEAGVWGVNQTLAAGGASAVLAGSLTAQGITFAPIAISEGWMSVATPGLGTLGLPVIGGAFTKASSNASTNYGWNTDHRVTRVAGYAY